MKKIMTMSCVLLVLMLTGCGGEKKPTGKYTYGSSSSPVYGYYTCEKDNKCDWYMYIEDYGKSTAEYEYTSKKNEDGTYTLHMTNTSSDSNTNYDVIYNPEEETIVDDELGITYKKN